MVVPIQTTLAFVFIGSAAIAAGMLGMRLPAGDRISAGLTLLVGAGVGVISLAVGTDIADSEGFENVFLIASALGFVATLASLALLWRWTERRRRAEGPEPADPVRPA
jgi:peptidoglycan/LPS O-acetylase OafA/YrhL